MEDRTMLVNARWKVKHHKLINSELRPFDCFRSCLQSSVQQEISQDTPTCVFAIRHMCMS